MRDETATTGLQGGKTEFAIEIETVHREETIGTEIETEGGLLHGETAHLAETDHPGETGDIEHLNPKFFRKHPRTVSVKQILVRVFFAN